MKQEEFPELAQDFKVLLEYALDELSTLTKDEADFIENICKWTGDQRSAFLIAKKVFEEETEEA